MRRRESSTLAKTDCSRLPGKRCSISAISSTSDSRVASTPRLPQRRGQQRQRAGVAVDGVHELLDLLAGGVAGSAAVPAGGVQHALDQLHRILAVEPVQLPPLSLGGERRGQRLAAGEDEPGVAGRIEPAAERKDGVQLVARVLGEGRRRFLCQEGRQEDALHVVHHQQRRLLGQRRARPAGWPSPGRRTWRRSNPAPQAGGRGHRAPRRRGCASRPRRTRRGASAASGPSSGRTRRRARSCLRRPGRGSRRSGRPPSPALPPLRQGERGGGGAGAPAARGCGR